MAVFITGGHGHVGSWTAYLLAKAGERIIIYDMNPDPPDLLAEAEVSAHITFIHGDVMDFPRLTGAFRTHGEQIEGIIHTVAVMGQFVTANPHGNVLLNIGGFLNVLEAARLFQIRKILYTSTGAVYGAVQGIASEHGHPPDPADLYAATKASCEFVGRQYASDFDLDFRVCRLYFVYGPGRVPSQFIPIYKVAFGALEGLEGLKFERGADQKLDFTHVEDAARGVMLLYQARDLEHRLFNIATGVGTSIAEVAKLAQRHSHFPSRVDIGPGTLLPRCEALDITRAKKELGYWPKYGLEQGIQHYANWLDQVLKGG